MVEERAETPFELLARFGLGEEDAAAWQDSGRPASEFGDWLTDRVARCPAGVRARQVYGAEEIHDFARRAILAALKLKPGERLLDIGCGGGLLLRDAVGAGARAAGLDHSAAMVELARERAPGATVVQGQAERLPFAAESFEAVSMSVVFLFLEDPVGALAECRRVLCAGGRLALFTSAPELRGTPAAPEPLAAHLHFYDDHRLAQLARDAGLADPAVYNDGGGQLLTASA
jgi:SAM-dependent methyltransferase